MKQAKPTAAECAAFLRFMQGLESIIESVESPDGSEIDVHDNAECMEWIESQWRTIGPIWQRVYWAGQTCINNACDPTATTLEWRDELKDAAGRIER
jgi:hypothetical protein